MSATDSAIFRIGGELAVHRMGYGAMQLTGPGVWGPPGDEANARAVLRRAVELGVDFIDTADVYGPRHNERLIAEALHPYGRDLVIATKGGLLRRGPSTRDNLNIGFDASPAHIRSALEESLRILRLERIDLYHLHRVDPATPIEETMAALDALRREGKIGHIGLSEVGIAEIERARVVTPIAAVQNVYNLATRKHDDVLAYCEANGIAFIAFWPLLSGDLARSGAMAAITRRTGATPAQVALAWLLHKSASIIPIPGTASIPHLEENIAAGGLSLTEAEMAALEEAGAVPRP